MQKIVAFVACAVLITSATAFAKEEQGHGDHHKESTGKHHADPQMVKLHKMMPKYAKAQAAISAALQNGDLKAVAPETGYLLSTTADLKKSKPHKNVSELEHFKKIAAGFEQDVKNTAQFAGKGDRAGAKAAFADAQKRCDVCHAKFRGRT